MKRITSIKVRRSAFFQEDFSIDFSDKLNCIMGGRGTGKSTVLEFINACLNVDAEINRTSLSLLQGNLEGGTIELHLTTEDGRSFRIDKVLGQAPQVYQSPNNDFYQLENVLNDIGCDIYGAQKIEEIGRNSQERLKLIDRMVSAESSKFRSDIRIRQNELAKNASELKSINERLRERDELLQTFSTVDVDLQNLKATQPKDVDDELRKEFDEQEEAEKKRATEKRYLSSIGTRFDDHSRKLESLHTEVENTRRFIQGAIPFYNASILKSLNDALTNGMKIALLSVESALNELKVASEDLEKANAELEVKHAEQANEFVRLRQTLDQHRRYYDQQSQLTSRVHQRDFVLEEIRELESAKQALMEERAHSVEEFKKVKQALYTARFTKIQNLNSAFLGERVRVTLTPGGITDEYENLLRNALKGKRIQYNTLIPAIITNLTPDSFAEIVHRRQDGRLSALTGLDQARAKTIIDTLHDSDAIFAIEALYCPDLPDFHLKIDKENDPLETAADLYRPSDSLSTGQRCTAVLPIVFAISTNPLVIDQPEDNLDNRYISETIRDILIQQKQKRQLIFITHNPNIPVLSDAEYNLFLEYRDGKAFKLHEGSVSEVKQRILDLLEGGRQAFERREELYGNQ